MDCDHICWKSEKLIAQTISPTPSLFVAKRQSTYSQGTWGNSGETRGGVGKSGVIENKSGNISEMRKDTGKVTIGTRKRSFERCHPRPPIRPPLPQDWGFATPTQISNLKSRENECTEINSMYGRHRIFFWGGEEGGVDSVGIARDRTNFWLVVNPSLPAY